MRERARVFAPGAKQARSSKAPPFHPCGEGGGGGSAARCCPLPPDRSKCRAAVGLQFTFFLFFPTLLSFLSFFLPFRSFFFLILIRFCAVQARISTEGAGERGRWE